MCVCVFVCDAVVRVCETQKYPGSSTRHLSPVRVMLFVGIFLVSLISAQLVMKRDGNMSAAVHLDVLLPHEVSQLF